MVNRILFSADDGTDGPALWISDGTAPGTSLIADINPGVGDPSIGNFTLLGGGRALFTADDGTTGLELWVTDGGPGGTFLVKDIRLDVNSAIASITALGNGLAVFQANDGTTGRELWATDGTEAGTLRLADMVAGAGSSAATTFAVLADGRAVFTGNDGTTGNELWVTDGTVAGTGLVKDIRAGAISSTPSGFVALGDGRILFRATNTAQGSELWVSDGTTEGTILVQNIRPGTLNSSPSQITALGDGRALFRANDGTHGSELWITDGTTAGTAMVQDITPGTSSSSIDLITSLGDGRALFQADDGTHGPELWVTDGTEAGTSLLFELQPGDQNGYYPSVLEIVSLGNGTAVFAGDDDIHGRELWVTDGTTGGTSLLRDFMPGSNDGAPGDFVANGDGTAFFVVDDPVVGAELWVTDGTLAGTHLVADVNSHGNPDIGGYPSGIGSSGPGEAIFVADDGTGSGVWITDGTTAGTVRLLDGLSASYAPGAFELAAGVTLFGAATADLGFELWVTDGTAAGTSLLKDINTGTAASYLGGFFALGDGTALFSAGEGDHGFELWITDGTSGGTSFFKDLNPGIGSSYAYGLTALGNGLIVFAAGDDAHSTELWVTDGTVDGTVLLKDINPGAAYSSPYGFTPIAGNRALFSAIDGNGSELWVTDGTLAGTTRVKDINTGAANGNPQAFTALGNGQTVFKANDGSHGLELWTTDGTEAGTTLVKDIQTGSGYGLRNGAITALGNGLAVFAANDGINGIELWVTDGSEAGTSLLKDIRTGSYGSQPYAPVALGDGTALFIADDGVHGYELWRTDGTAGGTSLLKEIRPGITGGFGSSFGLTSLGDGRVVFSANDGSTGPELWVSDGTEAGTVLLKDIMAGVTASSAANTLFLLPENLASDAPTGLDITAILDTGASATDNITTTTSLVITGFAAPDVVVTLRDGAAVVGQVRSDAVTGAWSITPATLADGIHSFSATALNASLNTSGSSAVLTVRVDNADPLIAITSSGGTVATARQTISGTVTDANAGGSVQIFDNGGETPIATATVGPGGAWSVSVDLGADGAHGLVAFHTDLAGNAGSSAVVAYTLDTSVPPPSVGLAVGADNGPSGHDGITGISAPGLTGVAKAAALVTVQDGATLLGTASADGTGAWSFATPELAQGTHTLSVTQTSGGSTSAAATLDVTIDARLQSGTAAADVFVFATEAAFTDPVRWVDGLGGTDMLALNFTASLADAAFAGLLHLETLRLGGAGAQDLVLGPQVALGFGARISVVTTMATSLTLDASALGAGTALDVRGSSGDDSITGGAGDDILRGGLGSDHLVGGLGDDLVFVDQAGDVLVEQAAGGNDRIIASINWVLGDNIERLSLAEGADLNGTGNALANRIDGNAGNNILDGGDEADSLHGNDGADTLLGGAGADVLTGGADADRMVGGTGNDVYRVDDTTDEVVELADGGDDRVIATVDWTLGDEVESLSLNGDTDLNGNGNAAANRLTGNAGGNRLDGGGGDDTIFGMAGADTLVGGAGADLLNGDAGADQLQGGLEADRFLFRDAAEANGDVILDFNALDGDRIDLRPIDANGNLAGNQAFTFIGTAAFGGVAGQLRFADGFVAGDISGDGLADFQIEVTAAVSLSASDFWL